MPVKTAALHEEGLLTERKDAESIEIALVERASGPAEIEVRDAAWHAVAKLLERARGDEALGARLRSDELADVVLQAADVSVALAPAGPEREAEREPSRSAPT